MKERRRGARQGRTEAQKEHFKAHNARRRCLKKKFEGIHDRFLKDSTYRDSQLKIDWTGETCIAMNTWVQEDDTRCPLPEVFDSYRKNRCITLKKSGRNAPVKLRSDFREAPLKFAPSPPWIWRRRPEPIRFINTKGGIFLLRPVPHGGSGTHIGVFCSQIGYSW